MSTDKANPWEDFVISTGHVSHLPLATAFASTGVLPNATFLESLLAPATDQEKALRQEVDTLRAELEAQQLALQKGRKETDVYREKYIEQQHTAAKLERTIRLAFIQSRLSKAGGEKLYNSEKLRNHFLGACSSYVISVDIRRSTEMMLKARNPEIFAKFMTGLATSLQQVIVSHNGVFDKFTGDGVIAFFPEFYSGNDAGYYAVAAADACHSQFSDHYRKNRHCFTSVLMEVGLGIGIDYGETHLTSISDGLTVVGVPVVYACRMSGGPPGQTLLNQPAYEKIFELHSSVCTFSETQLNTKHEGSQLAYAVKLNGKAYKAADPGFLEINDDQQKEQK